ncbi:putative ABC multidrug transporter [Seiridium unicorne]|uniref:ABC multidrug transporter n=1 Tax=Seiridium unicorne TaxID=138068 RepID=A0ABR2VIC8_9PEZI
MNVTDDAFGPRLEDAFDFTLLFEQSIFLILPSALLLVLVSARALWLYGGEIRARAGRLLWAKMGSVTVICGANLVSLILWALPSTAKTRTALPAAILSFLATIALGLLVYGEHTRSIGPSKILSAYLVFSALLDIAQARSLITRGTYSAIGSLCVASIVAKAVLICLEEVPKRALFTEKHRNAALESTSGNINRTVFWWLQGLFRKGFSSLLFLHDLSPVHEKLATRALLPALEHHWQRGDQKGKHALATATISAFKVTCITAALPRLCLTGFRFAQPFFIERVINFIAEPVNKDTQGIARGLIGAAVLIYLGIAVTRCYYQHLNFQLVTIIRGGLVAMIFDKTMRLDHSMAKDSEAITLMSADIEGIEPGVELIHEIWASVVELGIGLYLLQRQIGAACFFVVIPAIVASILTSRLIRAMGPARMLWSKGIQKRVAEASRMLSQIKSLKITGLASYTADAIQNLRVKELVLSRKFRLALIRILTTSQLSDQMTPVVVVAGAIFWTRRGTDVELTVAEVFAVLAVVTLVSAPISQLISCLPNVMASVACFDRIQEYLALSEIQDPRLRSLQTHAQGSNPPTKDKPSTNAVVIERGYFKVAGRAQYILDNINIYLPTSTYTAVIGPVGSGKSTLLRIILGEQSLTQGSIQVNQGLVAYCDQTPWLRNVSIRENILGQTDYDESWYETVVQACSLPRDLAMLPNRDMTLVGSGGIALSGGQKHRVALARAIYSRKPILLLDDVFSALDNLTSRTVFNNLLGVNGLLRKSDITVILAAHSGTLKPTAVERKVVILDKDGRTAHQNEPSALSLPEDEVKHLTWEPEPEDEDKQVLNEPDTLPATEVAPDNREKHDLERQTGDFGLYKFYFSSVNPLLAISWLVLAIVYIGFGRAPQLWLRFWSENGMNENPGPYFGAYFAFAISCVIASAMSVSFFMLKIVPESAQTLHEMFLQTVVKAPLWFFSTTDSGITLNRFSQDMTLFDNRLPVAMYHTIYGMHFVLLSTALIAVGAQYFAAIIPVCAVALYLLAKFYLRTSRQIRHLDLEAKSPLYTLFTDTIDGLVTIRAFGWKSAFLENGLNLLDSSQKPYYLLFCIQRWLNIMLDFFVAIVAVVLVAFAVNFQGTTTQGALGVALINIISFNTELTELVNNWTDLETSLGAIARLRYFLRETPSEDAKGGLATPLPGEWPTTGAIQFEDVSAAYKEGTDLVLRNITLQIQPGQRVGICGRTGCGKTSLILSLLGLLDLKSGSIKVDGLDLSTANRQLTRTKISTLPQDPVALPGTVRQNLVSGTNSISDESLVSTLKKLNIWNLVEEAGGLEKEFSELTLSRGQQQLFCLARALLHKSKVLLLDEPTSNIDHKTASDIQALIEEEFQGCTTLAVVHKLEMVVDWDVVIVIDAGEVVEVDTKVPQARRT